MEWSAQGELREFRRGFTPFKGKGLTSIYKKILKKKIKQVVFFMDRPDGLPTLTENLRKHKEAPVLSAEQVDLVDSGYVDDFEEALELLEESEQVKPDYLDKPFFS